MSQKSNKECILKAASFNIYEYNNYSRFTLGLPQNCYLLPNQSWVSSSSNQLVYLITDLEQQVSVDRVFIAIPAFTKFIIDNSEYLEVKATIHRAYSNDLFLFEILKKSSHFLVNQRKFNF